MIEKFEVRSQEQVSSLVGLICGNHEKSVNSVEGAEVIVEEVLLLVGS